MNEKGEIIKSPDAGLMKRDLYAVSISDAETRKTIESFYRQSGKVLEPHGAVAWTGLQHYLSEHRDTDDENRLSICLETAHPGKFREEIKNILGINSELPDSLGRIETRNEDYISLENNFNALKEFIIQNY